MNIRDIDIPHEAIAEFCRRHGIRRLAFFGSLLREDFGADSDIDVLVEFHPNQRVGLRFFRIEQELSELLGRSVDLNTPGFLSPRIREDVLEHAEVAFPATLDGEGR